MNSARGDITYNTLCDKRAGGMRSAAMRTKTKTETARVAALLAVAVAAAARGAAAGDAVAVPWAGETVRDLHREYQNIFRYGNRNAASHRWATFLRAERVHERGEAHPHVHRVLRRERLPDHALRLQQVPARARQRRRAGRARQRPCTTAAGRRLRRRTYQGGHQDGDAARGESRQFHFAVIGNPCDDPAALRRPFVQPFDGRSTTLARTPQRWCNPDGSLEGPR